MKGLTRRQQDVLSFVEDYVKSRGYPPSVREIASHFSLVSASGVHKHIKALVRKGFIAKQDFTSRSIRVLRKTGMSRAQPVEASRWAFYGTLTSVGIRPRLGSPSVDWRPSDPSLSSGGILCVVDGTDFERQGIKSGDVLFITAQMTPTGNDLLLVEHQGRAELVLTIGGATAGVEGLRGVVVGLWRPMLGAAKF